MAVIHDSQGRGIDQNNPLNVTIAGSTATGGSLGVTTSDILPIDIQSHLQSTILTHNAVSIASNSWSAETSFHDSDGFTELAVTLKSDSTVATNGISILWSNDGTNVHGSEFLLQGATGAGYDFASRSASTPTKSRYFKIVVANYDAGASHTMSAYAYLKA
jgi:hypothetical protein